MNEHCVLYMAVPLPKIILKQERYGKERKFEKEWEETLKSY